jgi:4-alpha-glucanotransferase
VTAAPFADALAELRDIEPGLPALRDAPLVDYAKVWQAKKPAFEALFRAFDKGSKRSAIAAEFESFVATEGPALDSFAAFSALQEQHGRPWQQWPEVYRRPGTPAVERFIRQNKERVGFHLYLQFLADRQLEHAAASAERTGMEIGLIRDLAMGINPDGADAWAHQDAYIFALRCGAPPDDFNPHGQEWGVLPLHPLGLKRNFEPFVALLRANMRHAGGLRIDHVIGLQRLFLVPFGGDPSAGCYVRYPLDELLGLLALESRRNNAIVVGEDLGTVPEGFRERMHEKNILGCAILYFERARDGGFKGPRDYCTRAAVSAATHDLPTLAGFWEGRDIEERQRIGIYDAAEADAALAARRRDCTKLLDALRVAGIDPGDAGDKMTPALRDAIHAFLASSSAQLFLAQLDDLTGQKEQINMPGTTTQYANWRRKLSCSLEDETLSKTLRELSRISSERGRTAAERG